MRHGRYVLRKAFDAKYEKWNGMFLLPALILICGIVQKLKIK